MVQGNLEGGAQEARALVLGFLRPLLPAKPSDEGEVIEALALGAQEGLAINFGVIPSSLLVM